MATTLRHLRGPLIALAAILAASSAVGEASACSMMTRAEADCATACGCCSSAGAEAPAATAPTAVAGRTALPRAPLACETIPGGGCSCRSREPAAPAREPSRSTTQRRAESGHATGLALPGEEHAARIAFSSQLPLTQGPPKVPLYLRNERLLF